MPSRIAKTKRQVQRKNGKNLSAKTIVKTPSGIPPALARMLRPQAAFRWLGPQMAAITPTYIEMTLRGAMAGNHVQQWELFKMMSDTWPELSSCKQELQYGLMKKNLIFEAYHEEDEQPSPSAMEKSKVVSSALRQMEPAADHDESAIEGTIRDILNGWFHGVTVLEVIWHVIETGKLGTIAAPRTSFFVDPVYYGFNDDGWIGLRPLDKRGGGSYPYPASTSSTAPPQSQLLTKFPKDKFVVGIHKANSGTAMGGALLRPLCWWWCASNFSSDWLLNLAQVFGLPFRWANYSENAPQETVDAICSMLQNMGSSGWAAFPVGTTMELKAPPGGTGSDHSPQGELLDRADRYCRTLILGQTMTGNAGTTGKGGGQAFGMVEADVKNDRIDAAGRFVAEVLNHQLIKSILALNYGETSEAPTARFLEEEEGALATAQRDQVLVSMGMPIGVDYLRKKYDIPEPAEGEEVVSGISTGQQAAEDAKTEMAKAALEQKANDPNEPPGDPNKPPPQGKKPDGKAMKAGAGHGFIPPGGRWVTIHGTKIFLKETGRSGEDPEKASELRSRDDGLDFYLGDLREKFFNAFKGDLAPLRAALEVALAEKSETEQREALIALKPQLPQLLKTFITEGVSAQILAKAIAKGFTEGWQQPKTEVADATTM